MLADRVTRLNPSVNAVVTLDLDRAMEKACLADEATAKGDRLGPLHGLPITVKDAIATAGIRSTGGAPELAHNVPLVDAPVVSRVTAAGAIVFGKTNVPKWSGDIQTYNELFGTTSNPWDQSRTPGGSSGGAATAVACGLTGFEIGTDIGGSIRIPSGYCGVYGHKASYGIVSQRGYLDRVDGGVIDSDINVFGPIGRAASDLRLLLDILAGPDEDRAVAWQLTLPLPRHDDLSSYRVGACLDDVFCSVDTESAAILESAATALSAAGARVTSVRPPVDMADAFRLFNTLLVPAISTSVDDPGVGEAISGTHRSWLLAHHERTVMRQKWAEWFRHFDALLCPIMPVPAFEHDQHGSISDRWVDVNGSPRSQIDCFAWVGMIGVAYLPSTAVPVGRTRAGLPVGMQIVGPYLEDRTPLFLAERLAELTEGFVAPPLAR
jgi:amidase